MFIRREYEEINCWKGGGGVGNERIPPRVNKVHIVVLENVNKEVSLQEPQVPPEPQEPQVPQVPHMLPTPFIDGDMTNA